MKDSSKAKPKFPLWVHKATGRWCKKIGTKFHYFGYVADDPKGDAALKQWTDDREGILAGRKRRSSGGGGNLTMAQLCNEFLTSKRRLVSSGEIRQRTWDDYKATTDRLCAVFGNGRSVDDLRSDDFELLRENIAKTRGPVSLGNEIQRVRVVFKFAYDASLIEQPVRYGPTFKKPSTKVLRLARAEKGPRMIEAPDLRRLIEAADVPLKAMVLLGLNCGFGNSDCGTLPLTAVDLAGGWVNYHRPKTGVSRRCALWPETRDAIKAAIAARHTPKAPEAEPLLFITRRGASWAKEGDDNPVSKQFRKLLTKLDLHRPGLGFYSLRHAHRTVSDEARDQPAANHVMGHADASMAGVYRERIGDDRLRAVADHVRAWLFPATVEAERKAAAEAAAAAAKPARKPRKAKAEPVAEPQAGLAAADAIKAMAQLPKGAYRVVG